MSVYTSVTAQQLKGFLKSYSIGELVEFSGIQDGIDNTNYRLETTQGKYILTLFENLKTQELPFFLNLLTHLQQANISCPQPQADNNGEITGILKSKATAIFSHLSGSSVLESTLKQCEAIGSELGKIHLAGLNYPEHKDNQMGEDWLQTTLAKIQSKLSDEDKNIINKYLLNETQHKITPLPQGIIHADLFKDNALFDGDKLTGVLDFYLACYDDLLLDLAITVNDWCHHQGKMHAEKITALVTAYQQQRPLTENEKKHSSFMLQKTALIFWVSRLECLHFPRASELTIIKGPDIYKQIFRQHLETPFLIDRFS